MRKEEKYLEIINQAFSPELAGLNAGDPGFTEIAETLSNDLYRLTIEFGVSFNDFKSCVMQEVLDHSRSHQAETDSEKGFSMAPLLVPARSNLPILVFAFELMADDQEFETE